MIARVLAIAGSDSGGGAGIQADIKTITMLGGHAMTAITALTAQNSLGVTQVMAVPAAMVLAQIDAVVSDIGVDAIKIGMIGDAATAEALVAPLDRIGQSGVPIVFDPVMIATSGAVLANPATISAFARLMDVATLVTPNAPELATLSRLAVEDEAGLEDAAYRLAERHAIAVLAKGGHLAGDRLTDILVAADGTVTSWSDARIETRHSHGTGRLVIRKSGTEPLIRVMAEGEDRKLVESMVDQICEAVRQAA
jgi:hydroxymethylpyrimidine/phosphomethylpyrimidine kinase